MYCIYTYIYMIMYVTMSLFLMLQSTSSNMHLYSLSYKISSNIEDKLLKFLILKL